MYAFLEVVLAVGSCFSLVMVLAACVCGCKKDSHKSELVGTAGVVKLRFDEESQLPVQSSPLQSKRVSSQRSLPEIPPTVASHDSGDTASGFYATVGINQRIPEQASPTAARRADHSYEHEYARLQDGHRINEPVIENETLVTNANNSTVPLLSPLSEDSQGTLPDVANVITASNAISGQVSSSRELPYMTPPIAAVSSIPAEQLPAHPPNQHFSGDSVDSTKGYTSISVREPLSSIRTNMAVTRSSQPHYATVSDDSDEMYAAIDDPTNQVYTSGSETYAQIQPANPPPNNPVTSAPTPPTPPAQSSSSDRLAQQTETLQSNTKRSTPDVVNLQGVEKHARQSSNSSHVDGVGTIGSPKPEKRQANSPLPPPPPSSSTIAEVTVHHKKTQDSPSHHHSTKHHHKHHKISSTGNLHDSEKLRRSLNEKHQRNNSCVSSSDFYGCNYPVDHRFSSGDLVRPLVARELNFSLDNKPCDQKSSDAIYNTIDGGNNIYAAIDQGPSKKTLTLSQPNVTGSPVKNVEEMYAKVIKPKKAESHRSQPSSRLSNYDDLNSLKAEQNANQVHMRKKHHDGEKKSRTSDNKRYSGNSVNDGSKISNKILNVQTLEKDDPGYETIEKTNKSHGYEIIDKSSAISKSDRSSDPGYETVKELNKNIENKKHKAIPTVSGGLSEHSHNSVDLLQRIALRSDRTSPGNEPGYETVTSGPNSLLSNDPGYENIHRSESLRQYASDSDPNYEVLRSRNSTPPYASIKNQTQNNLPEYSVINKKSKTGGHNWATSPNNNENFSSEPNYESMPHENTYNTGSESDPNYESVGPKDPNYESVKYFDVAPKDPPYEKVKSESNQSGDACRRSNSSASYEKIKPKSEKILDNRTNGANLNFANDNVPVSDYFQV